MVQDRKIEGGRRPVLHGKDFAFIPTNRKPLKDVKQRGSTVRFASLLDHFLCRTENMLVGQSGGYRKSLGERRSCLELEWLLAEMEKR